MSRKLRLVLLLTAIMAPATPGIAATGEGAPGFVDESPLESNEGHATLRWALPESDSPPTGGFELQQSRRSDFANHTVRHEGPASSFFASGLEEGVTWFRVRALAADGSAGPWSAPIAVQVEYPATGRVIILLATGSLVFLATVLTILTGWSRSRRAGPGDGRPAGA